MWTLTELEKRVILDPEGVMKDYHITESDLHNYNSRYDDYDDSIRGQAMRKLLNRDHLVEKYQFIELATTDLSKYVDEDKLFIKDENGNEYINWEYVDAKY